MLLAFALVAFVCIILSSGTAMAATDKVSGREQHVPVCPGPAGKDAARCHARAVVDEHGVPKATTLPAGYGPAQFHGAYTSATTAPFHAVATGSTTISVPQVIAIVDAYDDPNILNDLKVYSQTYGIPTLPACTVPVTQSSVPCFQKVNQRGGASSPRADAGWSLEIALDVETAHAMCQNCSILLVEADSNSFANLLAAEDYATSKTNVVSNSWGGSEFSGQTSPAYDGHFNRPGVAITVSSGDAGYGVEYPAASQYVAAVGGTTLTMSGNAYGSESAWSGAGSGCSLYEGKPAWQHDPGCANRTVADVSADADPSTGAAVYDTVRYQGRSGWFKVGGTSLAAPIIAGVYALSGNTAGAANSLPYSNTGALHDVTSGQNGSCGGSYLCTAVAGFDGPTGLGTPFGLAAF